MSIMEIMDKMERTNDIDEKLQLSVELARAAGVPEEKIFHSVDELDEFFMSDKPFVL